MTSMRSNVNAMHKQNRARAVIHRGNLLFYLCHANNPIVYLKYEIVAQNAVDSACSIV